MKNPRLASLLLLMTAVTASGLPVVAGQIHHPARPVHHSAPVVRYHAPRRVTVTRFPRARVAPPPHPIVADKGIVGITIAVSTPILSGPSANAAVLKHVPAGTPIPHILGEQNGYCEYIRYTHDHAWVPVADLRVDGMPSRITVPTVAPQPQVVQQSVPDESGHCWGTSIAPSSAILTEPSRDAKVIKTIPVGTHVPDIIGEQNGYYEYIRWTHKTAWIAMSDVRLGEGAAPEATVPGANGEPGQP